MPKFLKKNKLVLFWSLNILLAGCKPGIDYSELALDPADIIDYGEKVTSAQIGPGPSAYALIRQGVEHGGSAQLEQELTKIAGVLKEIKDLPSTFDGTFNTAQKKQLDLFLDGIEKKIAIDIRPKIINASLSAPAAIELQVEMEKNIKSDGYLTTKLEALKKDIPAPAQAKYESAAKILRPGFERIYQLATVFSQSIAQKKAKAELYNLKKALDHIKEMGKNSSIFGNTRDADDAKLAILSTLNEVEGANKLVAQMTGAAKMKNGLIKAAAALKSSLLGVSGLKARFVDKVTAPYKAPVQASFDEASSAVDRIAVIFNDYDERPKSSSDKSLQALNEEAFSGKVSAGIDSMSLSDETELVRFIKLLSLSKITGLGADEASEAFIQALAVAIVNKIAEVHGLLVDNIYGLNYAKLNETKTTFGMSDTAFRDYLNGIARKGFERTSNKDQNANIYVLFADRFASGANIEELMATFSQGKSRVIMVANRPADYKANMSFQSLGLDLVSAMQVASSVLHSVNPKLNAPSLAESLVKLMYGFRKTPEQVNLVSVEHMVKAVVARLGGANEPSETEVLREIKYALAASKEAYDTHLMSNSGVLLDNLKMVEENVKSDPVFYFNEAKGIGKGTRDAEMRKLAEIRKYEEARRNSLRAAEARRARKQLAVRAKGTRRRLVDLSASLDPAPALAGVRAERASLIVEIDRLVKLYGQTAEKIYELSLEDREALEASGGDFKTFFAKINEIVADTSYFSNLRNLNAVQISLRNDANKYLPREVLTMLDRYPLWHPYAYFGAVTRAAAFSPAVTIADIDTFYASLVATNQFEVLPAGPHPLKTAAIAEYADLRALAGGAAHPTDAAALLALSLDYRGIPQPAALKPVRFVAGTVGATYFANQPAAIKTLAPIWDDLLDLTQSIQRSANKIYEHLTKVKKRI